MTTKVPKGVFMASWARDIDTIRSWFRRKPRPKRLPRLLNKFGAENFKLTGDTLYYKGLEIVTDEKRREEILSKEESGYGGSKAVYYRLQRKYIGVPHLVVAKYLGESERRQLKQRTQSAKSQRSFIHAPRPGYLQADLTFYDGHKIPVFGVVDVFSRWCYYEVLKDKTPPKVLAALKAAFASFKSLAPQHSIYKVATDDGSEFKGTFQAFLENYKEDPKKFPKWQMRVVRQKQPQRLIEALNGNLRRYVERVDFKDKAELRKQVGRFVGEYNDTRHAALGPRTPSEVMKLKDKAVIKREAERQFVRKKGKVTTSGFKLRKLVVGSLVRVSLRADKDQLGHAGAKPNWSKRIFRVHRILKSKRGKDRYVIHTERTNTKHGIYFRDKLLAVSLPKHAKGQVAKYQGAKGWGGEYEEQERMALEDAKPKPEWKKKRPDYRDAEDERADSGEEVDLDLDDEDTSDREDEKKQAPPPKKKAKAKGKGRVRAQQKSLLGRTVVVEGYRGLVVEIYRKDYYITVFEEDESVMAYLRSEIRPSWHVQPAEKWKLAKLKKKYAEQIKGSKKEVDDELG